MDVRGHDTVHSQKQIMVEDRRMDIKQSQNAFTHGHGRSVRYPRASQKINEPELELDPSILSDSVNRVYHTHRPTTYFRTTHIHRGGQFPFVPRVDRSHT